MMRANDRHRRVRRGRGFTLVELMITIMIIGIMATMLVFALFSAQETARAQKTKSLIAKLDAIIKAKWDAYKTRRVPVSVPAAPAAFLAGGSPNPASATWKANASILRLYALHDLMRMELPDRWSDVSDGPSAPQTFDPTVATAPVIGGASSISRPSVSVGYARRYNTIMSGPNPPRLATAQNYQGAECLYLIVTSALQEDGDSREVFKPDDVADTDGDGFPEFVDGWKQPIRFLRWAPGFQLSELQIVANNLQANGTSVTGPSLNAVSGSYVGGALIPLTGTNNQFNSGNAAKLTGYQWSGGTAQITTAGGSPSGLSVICALIHSIPPDLTARLYPVRPASLSTRLSILLGRISAMA